MRAVPRPPGGAPEVRPYEYADVVAALQAVLPYDWNGFFEARVRSVAPHAPLGGIENGGWKLAYTDVEPDLTEASEGETKIYDFWYSLGIVVDGEGGKGDTESGSIRDVVPGLPAAAAGIAPGMRLVAVNGRRYSERVLRDALRQARSGKEPIDLLVENDEMFHTFRVGLPRRRAVSAPRARRVEDGLGLGDRQAADARRRQALSGKLLFRRRRLLMISAVLLASAMLVQAAAPAPPPRDPSLPPSAEQAKAALDASPRHGEYVDVPVAGGAEAQDLDRLPGAQGQGAAS